MISWSQIEALISVRTTQDLINAIFAYSREAGFDNFALAIKFSAYATKKGKLYTRHNCESELAEKYARLQYQEYADGDARVALCSRNIPAIAWGSDDWTAQASSILPDRLHRQFGCDKMRCGITIPLTVLNTDWGFAEFSSSKKISTQELEEKCLDAVHFINYCSHTFDKISKKSDLKSKLSSREIEVLEWASVGKTSWEIALILDLSERTINFHLSNAADKLGVKGRRAACSAAITRGLINI